MFNLDQHVISETKALAKRAERVLQLANETGPTPESATAILAIGGEIAAALTQLSRAVQARIILKSTLATLQARAENMQRSQGIEELAMLSAFTWQPTQPEAWGELATYSSEDDPEAFGDESDGDA